MDRYNATVTRDCTNYLLWVRTQNHLNTSPDYFRYSNVLNQEEIQIVIPILEPIESQAVQSTTIQYQTTVHKYLKIKWDDDWEHSCMLNFKSKNSSESSRHKRPSVPCNIIFLSIFQA